MFTYRSFLRVIFCGATFFPTAARADNLSWPGGNPLMWADGEEPITVQMRRTSDPALPSEADPKKVSLKSTSTNPLRARNGAG